MGEYSWSEGPVLRQFRIELLDVTPKVWRTIIVPLDISMYRFSRIIQEAMGWLNYHLYLFEAGKIVIAEPDPEFGMESLPGKHVKLSYALKLLPDKFIYEYDFGDSWRHEVVVQDMVEPVPGVRYPMCTGGSGHCPPEDCGGTSGYADFLEIIKDPTHPEYHDTLTWAGGSFDPEAFSVEEVNERFRLAQLTRVLRRAGHS